VSGEREWPVVGFQYRCSAGHWVMSRKDDLVDTNCPAVWPSGDATVPVPCHGTLGCPVVDGEEAADEIKRLRADLAAERAEVARLMDGMELAWGLIANGQYCDRTDGRR